MNLFEKHAKKKKQKSQEHIKVDSESTSVDSMLGNVTLKKLDTNADVSFFKKDEQKSPAIQHKITPTTVAEDTEFHFSYHSARELYELSKDNLQISTGSASLDLLLNGGISGESLTEFYGEYATGKTQLCFQIAVNAVVATHSAATMGKVFFLDTEGTFKPDRIIQIAKAEKLSFDVLEHIYVARAFNTDTQMRYIQNLSQLIETEKISLIIIDSLTALFRSEFATSDHLVERQQKLNVHLQHLKKIATYYNIPVLLTNQVVATMNNSTKAVGGNVVAHSVTHRIRLTKLQNRSISATLEDSPNLASGQAMFKITTKGIE